MVMKEERRGGPQIARLSPKIWPRYQLRRYQIGPAQAVLDAIIAGQGGSFVWVFSRQSGKDETLAQLLACLLTIYSREGGHIVVTAPTQRQAQISRDRLIARLDNPLYKRKARQREGYIVGLERAEARFLSASPAANVRGETASLLLVANESQDIVPEHWDAVFDPMAASTNAVTLFLGTVWHSRTLLARQMRHLRELEHRDGKPRVFLVDWRQVAQELPNYGKYVAQRIAQFGPDHPFIRTEYELKELDGNGGLFPSTRLALMQGSHPRQSCAIPGKTYALLVDVAGGVEGEGKPEVRGQKSEVVSSRRDSTAVTVVEVSSSEFLVPGFNAYSPPFDTQNLELKIPNLKLETRNSELRTYKVVQRYVWNGLNHTTLYQRLIGLVRETWLARYVVIDATGIGAGLAAFLEKALPRLVIPFVFSSASKSQLGWDFMALVDSGRYQEYAPDGAEDTAWFWRQLEAVEYEVRPGPNHLMRWGVPNPSLHDDLVLSASLVAVLDGLEWRSRKAWGA